MGFLKGMCFGLKIVLGAAAWVAVAVLSSDYVHWSAPLVWMAISVMVLCGLIGQDYEKSFPKKKDW